MDELLKSILLKDSVARVKRYTEELENSILRNTIKLEALKTFGYSDEIKREMYKLRTINALTRQAITALNSSQTKQHLDL